MAQNDVIENQEIEPQAVSRRRETKNEMKQ